MVAQPNRLLTPDEYLAFERESELKHEYVAGNLRDGRGCRRSTI
ncbi:MAG: hypothetical protein U0232_13875 [Thermomicrobiales bacterium]